MCSSCSTLRSGKLSYLSYKKKRGHTVYVVINLKSNLLAPNHFTKSELESHSSWNETCNECITSLKTEDLLLGSMTDTPDKDHKSNTGSMLVKTLQAHIIQYIQQLKCDTQHLQKPPKHCFMHRTALSSKWNWRSVCMTPHYILQRKRRWNEMK